MKKEFKEAIANFDTWEITKIFEEKNMDIPESEKVFIGGIHTARLYLASATEEQREESKQWLIDHGRVQMVAIKQ